MYHITRTRASTWLTSCSTKYLYKVNIRKRLDGLRRGLHSVEVASLGLGVHSLQVLLLALASSNGSLDGLVRLLAGNNLLLASGGGQVRSGNVQLLAEDAAVNLVNSSIENNCS